MSAEDSVAHHNATLDGPFCQLVPAEVQEFR